MILIWSYLGSLSLLIEPKIGPKFHIPPSFTFQIRIGFVFPVILATKHHQNFLGKQVEPPPPINTLIQLSHPLIYSLTSLSSLRSALLCYLRSQTQWRTRANRPTRESTRYLLNSLLAFFEP